MKEESEIAKWYKGRAIFITGATGFMGKVMIEKLLRSCPDVGPIYILIRQKKETKSQDRIDEILRLRAFDELRARRPYSSLRDCLIPILGDLSLPDLGISPEDRRILQEKVSVVFHAAATVRFDEILRIATAINVGGTRALLELCRCMINLCAFVYVSTAFSNCTRRVIKECVYPPPTDPIQLKTYITDLNDERLARITPSLIGDNPNTYTFTKAMAEHVVAEYSTELPIVIARPSVIWNAWKEPLPGWIDSMNGPGLLVVPAAKGLLPMILGTENSVLDVIPVDICSNFIIAVAWEMGARKSAKLPQELIVYNCVSGPYNPVTWGEVVTFIDNCTRKYPSRDFLLTPNFTISNCRVKRAVTRALFQSLPAAVADFLTWLSGGKPKFRYYQRRIKETEGSIEYCSMRQWKFEGGNVELLRQKLSPTDREIFYFDTTAIDWKVFFDVNFLGFRRYLMNEKDETIPAAGKHLARRILLGKIVQFALIFATFFTAWELCGEFLHRSVSLYGSAIVDKNRGSIM